jgi:two-component system NtrC family sensor kinase
VTITNPVRPGRALAYFLPIGLTSKGMLVTGSRDPLFPNEADRALISVAANQAALELERLNAERALRETESRLRQLAEELEQRVQERTRQVETEIQERERAQAALRQAQRLEALGHLTGGVAHDFNNLLLVVSGNLELLRAKCTGPAVETHIDAIEEATRRGEGLTRQLLAFSRRQTLHPMVVDLPERSPKLVELVAASLRGDIKVKLDLGPDIWPIEVDPSELELALLNIAVNARDAMPRGGQLVISVRNRMGAPDEAVDHGLSTDHVEIAISDTGVGIPPEILPRVFEPFYTTKEIGRGTGLGLSQVYGFARQSGGTARIESEPGVGTVVKLCLPRSVSAVATGAPETEPTGKSGISCKILLVEDNDEVAEITGALLSELGCRIMRVQNAREALECLPEIGADLVFSDIVMPGGMNGVDLARAVRNQYPGTPVLLTTGYSSAVREAAAEGLPVLSKPYRRHQLNQRISELLGRSSHHTVDE